MIASFRNRGLRRFWYKNDASGIKPEWVNKVRLVLSRIDAADQPAQMGSEVGFHALKGSLKGRYSLTVSRNWRITFGWRGTDAIDVDLEDYHGD